PYPRETNTYLVPESGARHDRVLVLDVLRTDSSPCFGMISASGHPLQTTGHRTLHVCPLDAFHLRCHILRVARDPAANPVVSYEIPALIPIGLIITAGLAISAVTSARSKPAIKRPPFSGFSTHQQFRSRV